ncbi:MAG: GTP cyclohydrolase I FolE [Calditrichota bacterium]
MPIDEEKVREAVRTMLIAIGENPEREGLRRTPDRVARMFTEIFSGIGIDPAEQLTLFTSENHDEMIVMRDIPFYSMCEHHLLPFWGHVSICYIPGNNKVTGFSSLVRLVDAFARRPQLQERMTTELADAIMARLQPLGVMVVIKARQLCIAMQGVKKENCETITSAQRGFLRKQITRIEALNLMSG